MGDFFVAGYHFGRLGEAEGKNSSWFLGARKDRPTSWLSWLVFGIKKGGIVLCWQGMAEARIGT